MKFHRVLFLSICLNALPVYALTTCEDLSHIETIGVSRVVYQQVGCQRFILSNLDFPTLKFPDVVFSNDWVTSKIDDTHEERDTRIRWMWSSNRKQLIYNIMVDTKLKLENTRRFMTQTTVLERQGEKVHQYGTNVVQSESAESQVVLEVQTVDDLYDRP